MAEVVIIDKVEDADYQGKAFKKVTDKTGKTFNVKYGREGKLKAKWDLLIPGNAIEITWGTYNNIPFVQDFVVVGEAGEVTKLAPEPSEKVLPEHEEVIREARASVSEGKNRSFALSYAKDWCISKVQGGEDIKTFDVLAVAKIFESYLDTGVVIEKKKK